MRSGWRGKIEADDGASPAPTNEKFSFSLILGRPDRLRELLIVVGADRGPLPGSQLRIDRVPGRRHHEAGVAGDQGRGGRENEQFARQHRTIFCAAPQR